VPSSHIFFRKFASPTVMMWLIGTMVAASAVATAQTEIQARQADRFVDSMGVNVHLEYSNTPYKNYAAINEKLSALGMRHVRDEINDTKNKAFVAELQQLGNLGITLCGLIEGGNDYPPAGQALQSSLVVPMIQNLLPTIDAVEGPNEPDDGGFVYGPNFTPYPQGAIDESEDLWNIVKESSDPRVSALPVLVMSEGNAPDYAQLAAITPPPIDYATYGNMHAYQGGLVGGYQLAEYYMPYSRLLTANDPLWTTEMGYHNNTHYLSDNEQQGVSQRASAIYLPIAFLSGIHAGVLRTFSYELIDEAPDPPLASCTTNDDPMRCTGEGYYGLLNHDGTPKPAYTALKNLIAILREPGRLDFQPGSLAINFAGAPSTMRYTLLEKSNGDFYLAIWNDVPVYKPATATTAGRDVYPENVPVTLSFAAPYDFTVYAPNEPSGTNPTDAYTLSTTPTSIQINLPADLLLIRIAEKQ
jgi:hypothetical protein